jgi:tetratricopeptide (TPR) repeat protein
MAQLRFITSLIVVRCVKTWNFIKGIPNWLAQTMLALTGREAQASAMYRGSSSTSNINQANGSTRASTIHPIILCLIGIGGLQPVILVFAAERCVAPTATRVVSVQGNVTWSIVGSTALSLAKLNDLLCVGDTIRVGTKSRAVLRLPNETTIPLDQNTIFQLRQPITDKEPTLIELIRGAIHVITRTPKPFKVNTPYMNAAVEGTEFYVGVDAEEARVAVIEGKVNVSNEQGELLLTDNEAATAKQGQAPQKTLTIKPRDAVQWALYYPPLFDPRSRPGGETLAKAHDLYSQGKITDAIESLNAIKEAERSGDYYTYRAGLLLLVGRADEAEPDIETALKENQNNTDALSLKAIIAIVRNDKTRALELANEAVSIDDKSAQARIALSYALQANFKIEEALKAARQATQRDEKNALAWARVAELELSIPNYDKSKDAAEKAVKLNPNLARTQSVLGFANLTRIDIKAAKESFGKAIELDQADPLPHLGIGLATIREGNVKAGREEIEIATALDPENSLVRSYLGKAYYEEKRDGRAGAQFELAKERDPTDPTPYFYDAIRKQTENRPVEALQDLEESIKRNNNRAPYRSRLLLDEDSAARGASLARIFGDLGFDRLAFAEALGSVREFPQDSSAHRFLADAYSNLPRHEIARVSELLQAQLWQSVNIQPLQPQLMEDRLFILSGAAPGATGVNEFGKLFERNRITLQAQGLVGGNDTIGDQLLLSAVAGRWSYSLGQFHYKTDGFRENNNLEKDIYNAFVQARLSPNTDLQLELRRVDGLQGDLSLRFDPEFFVPQLFKEHRKIARFGAHHQFSPRVGVIVSAVSESADEATESPPGEPFFASEAKNRSLEVQNAFSFERLSMRIGAGHLRGRLKDTFFGLSFPSNLRARNIYAYLTFPNLINRLTVELGVSRDEYELKELLVSEKRTNPKFGLTWKVASATTLRFAAFGTLRRPAIENQTIEPTQVAGFNQLFDDFAGTSTHRTGIGVDHRFTPRVFAGAELTRRKLTVLQSGSEDRFTWRERSHRAYVYFTPNDSFAVNFSYEYDHFTRDPGLRGPEEFVEVKTHRIPFALNTFLGRNWSARLLATYINQSGEFNSLSSELFRDRSRFWVADASLTYRLPKRRGLLSLEVRNLFDKKFRFQETNFSTPTVAPERFAFARFSVQF